MERNIRVLIQLYNDGEICGGVQQMWSQEELSLFLLKLEGDVTIKRPEPNFIHMMMHDDDFSKTCKNFGK